MLRNITLTMKDRWKTVLVLISAVASAFTAGAFGGQLVIGAVQSLTGANVAVPSAELQVLEANWSLDAATGLVTAVDVLVTTRSSVWQLKFYELSVQAQCTGQGQASPTGLFVCSSGKTSAILPTQGIGIRPLRISLAKPVSPAIATVQNLNFVVTDLARVPPIPPKIFVGPISPSFQVSQGAATRIPFTVTGVSGIQPGTKVEVELFGNPKGVRATQSQILALAPSSTNTGVFVASSFFDIVADADAFVGDTLIGIRAQTFTPQGLPTQDDFALIDERIVPPPAGEPSDPNLSIGSLSYPLLNSIEFVVRNNGQEASGPFDIVVSVVVGQGACLVGMPWCAGLPLCRVGAPEEEVCGRFEVTETINVSREPGLAPGAQVTRGVDDDTMDAACFRDNPDTCAFTVLADYLNEVAEANEFDNSLRGSIDSADNQTPTIELITDRTIDEGEVLTVTPEASDADLPPEGLSYSLSGTVVAAGAVINPSTGIVTWVTDEFDGPDTYSATIRVTDSFDVFAEASFRIIVNEVNRAPTIGTITDKVIFEGQERILAMVEASDADFPRQILTYSLSGTATAAGAFVDPFGAVRWFPDEADGPGVYTATVRVSDGMATAETSFTITIVEVNMNPVGLGWFYGDRTVDEGQTLVAEPVNPAFDIDLPRQTLTYSLSGTAFDAGATVDPSTGVVTWVTDEADGPGLYIATVTVTDSLGGFTATSFIITVNEV